MGAVGFTARLSLAIADMITLAGTRGSQPNALNRGVPPSAIGDWDMILPTYVLYKLAVLIGPGAIQLMRDRGCPIAASTWTAWCARQLPERNRWCKLSGVMPPLDLCKFAPVTLRHMRSQGYREVLVCCNSGTCNHWAIMNVGHLPDDNLLGIGVVCTRCGNVGVDVVPNWQTQYDTFDSEFHRLTIRAGPWKHNTEGKVLCIL
jgi:hypothetical protein